jgi:hypothetical protein
MQRILTLVATLVNQDDLSPRRRPGVRRAGRVIRRRRRSKAGELSKESAQRLRRPQNRRPLTNLPVDATSWTDGVGIACGVSRVFTEPALFSGITVAVGHTQGDL